MATSRVTTEITRIIVISNITEASHPSQHPQGKTIDIDVETTLNWEETSLMVITSTMQHHYLGI